MTSIGFLAACGGRGAAPAATPVAPAAGASPAPSITAAGSPLSFDYVESSEQREWTSRGEEVSRTYIVRDEHGRAIPRAMVRWRATARRPERLVMPPPLKEDTANADGEWTLRWTYNTQGVNRVLACATKPRMSCEPSVVMVKRAGPPVSGVIGRILPGALQLEITPDGRRYEDTPNGETHVYETYTARDSAGAAVPAAVVRWRGTAYKDGRFEALPTVAQDTADAAGQWTMHWLIGPGRPQDLVLGCAARPGATCEPVELLTGVRGKADSIVH